MEVSTSVRQSLVFTDDADKELAALQSSFNVSFRKFKVGDLFCPVEKSNKKAIDRLLDVSLSQTETFSVPLLTAGLSNNGIARYGRPSDWQTEKMCIEIVQNGCGAGSAFVQPFPVAVLSDAYLIQSVTPVDSENVLLYLAQCIQKVTKQKFSYTLKAIWSRVKECEIILPVLPDGELALEYMEQHMAVLEKQALEAIRSDGGLPV